MNDETLSNLYYLQPRFGEQPRTKKAAEELVQTAPDHVLLVSPASHVYPSIELRQIAAGETVRYTDGKGRYYGTITRSLDGQGFVFDKDTKQ